MVKQKHIADEFKEKSLISHRIATNKFISFFLINSTASPFQFSIHQITLDHIVFEVKLSINPIEFCNLIIQQTKHLIIL